MALCVKEKDFQRVISASVHHISEALEIENGQGSHLRLVQTHGSWLIGKSSIAPTKYMSIPRLELTAAILSIKMLQLMQKEL